VVVSMIRRRLRRTLHGQGIVMIATCPMAKP
jgi:hypothetical protein